MYCLHSKQGKISNFLRILVLQRLRNVKAIATLHEARTLKYFTECEDLAAKLENEDFTPESLAVLSHLLEQLSPILEQLTTASAKSDLPVELELEEIKDTWRRCPFPIRRFVFEKGLFHNTVRKHATSPEIRWGFTWALILAQKNQTYSTALRSLLGLLLRFHRSATTRMDALSAMRITPSRPQVEKILTRLRPHDDLIQQGMFLTFSMDNHQQYRSPGMHQLMGKGNSMVHSLSLVVKANPLVDLDLSREPKAFEASFFQASNKEKHHFQDSVSQFTIFSVAVAVLEWDLGPITPPPALITSLEGEEQEREEQEDREQAEEDTEENPLVDPPDAEVDGEDAVAANVDDDDDDGSLSEGSDDPDEPERALPRIFTISESPPFNLLDRAAHDMHSTEQVSFTGKSFTKMLPQLLGKADDPQAVREALEKFKQEKLSTGQDLIFVMVDEKLHEACLKIVKASPGEFSGFIFVLDPFHLGWNMDKVRTPKSSLSPPLFFVSHFDICFRQSSTSSPLLASRSSLLPLALSARHSTSTSKSATMFAGVITSWSSVRRLFWLKPFLSSWPRLGEKRTPEPSSRLTLKSSRPSSGNGKMNTPSGSRSTRINHQGSRCGCSLSSAWRYPMPAGGVREPVTGPSLWPP